MPNNVSMEQRLKLLEEIKEKIKILGLDKNEFDSRS
jgi:hypothetical protein